MEDGRRLSERLFKHMLRFCASPAPTTPKNAYQYQPIYMGQKRLSIYYVYWYTVWSNADPEDPVVGLVVTGGSGRLLQRSLSQHAMSQPLISPPVSLAAVSKSLQN